MFGIYDEDTGEEPRCHICDSTENCSHIVAIIAITFGRCRGGALYGRDKEFFSLIEDVFEKHFRAGSEPDFGDLALNELWRETEFIEDGENILVDLISGGWFFLISLLEEEGAIQPVTTIIDSGPPGYSSAMAYLYDDDPSATVDAAKKTLMANLATAAAP